MSFSVNKLFNLTRSVLLVIALLGGVVALLWHYAPGHIDRLDSWIVAHYTGGYEERLRRAEERIGKEPEKAIHKFEALLADLAGVQKQDRLGRIKRRALFQLVQVLERRGDYPAALEWARQWIAFDPRDLNALYREAMLRYQLPQRQKEGVAAMARLYRMMPEVKRVALGYARLLYETGAQAQAATVVENYRQTASRQRGGTPAPVAEVFLDYGRGFSARTRTQALPLVLKGGRSGLLFTLKPGLRQLRIDPVESLVAPRLFLWGADGGQRYDLAREALRFHEMSRVGDERLGVTGEDPYLVWTLPAPWAGQPLAVLLVVTEDERPAWMLQGEADGAPPGTVPLALSAARRYLLEALARYPVELFWRQGEAPFSEQRKRRLSPTIEERGGRTLLEARFPVAEQASGIRIDLPPVPGISYRLAEVKIVARGGTLAVGSHPVTGAEYHDLARRDGWLTVTGVDPYIVFRLPAEAQVIRVDLRGEIR